MPLFYSSDHEKYYQQTLHNAISAVKQRKQKTRTAAREFGVPKSTLHDHLKRKPPHVNLKKLPKLLTAEEEQALVAFIQYMAHQGFPMTRTIVRCYVREILRRTGKLKNLTRLSFFFSKISFNKVRNTCNNLLSKLVT